MGMNGNYLYFVNKHFPSWPLIGTLKELQESMDNCAGRRDITEILLKTALITIQ